MKIKGICITLTLSMALALGGCKAKPEAPEELPQVSLGEQDEPEQKDGKENDAGDTREQMPPEGNGEDTAGMGEAGEAGNPSDGDALFEGGIVTGSVIEASQKECSINAVQEIGDELVVAAADNAGDAENQERIVYRENCVFQSVRINRNTQELQYTPSDSGSVKKEDSLIVYGSYGEDGVLYADRIYLYEFE